MRVKNVGLTLAFWFLSTIALGGTAVTFNGTSYTIPAAGELNWSALSNFLVDVGQNAAVGQEMKQAVRVATTTPVTVNAGTDFTVITDLGVAGAVAVNLPAGVNGQLFYIQDGKKDAATNNVTITPAAGTIGGAATLVLDHNGQGVLLQYYATGTDWKVLANYLPPGTIADADVSATAAVTRSKLATGTNYRILANNGSGVMSENAALTAAYPVITDANGQLTTEQYLAKARGGAAADMSSVTFPATGTLATLAGAEAFTAKDYDGGTASDTSRVTLPKNTKGNLDGLTRKEGTLVYASDLDKVFADDGSTLKEIGSGAAAGSGVNYVTESTFEDALTTGWATYADASSATPADGTGGSANITFAASNSTPVRGLYSGLLTKDAADRRGEGVSFDFTVDAPDANRVLAISADTVASANLVSGDVAVYVYDVTNAALITPNDTSINSGTGTFYAEFVTTSSVSYRLIFHVATTNANAYTLKVDNVNVGPGKLVQGPVVEGWKAATTEVAIKYGATAATNVTSYTSKVRRVGDSMDFESNVIFSGAANANGVLYVTIPNGLTIDSTKITAQFKRNWTARYYSTGTGKSYLGVIRFINSTQLSVIRADDGGATNAEWAGNTDGASNIPAGAAIANADYMVLEVHGLPIAEWSAGAYYGNEGVSYAAWNSAGAGTGAVVTGASGGVVPTDTPADIFEDFVISSGFSNIQPTDIFFLEIQDAGTGAWNVLPNGKTGGAFTEALRLDASNFIGAGLLVNGSSVSIRRGKYRAGTTTTWAGLAAGTRWRVRRASAAALAGFNVATTSQPVGLLQAGAIPGGTTGVAAATGYIGEYLAKDSTSPLATSGSYALVTGCSQSFGIGTWLIWGRAIWEPGTNGTYGTAYVGTNTTPTANLVGWNSGAAFTNGRTQTGAIPPFVVTLAAPATYGVYAVSDGTSSSMSATVYGVRIR